jgi:hypothetical protein
MVSLPTNKIPPWLKRRDVAPRRKSAKVTQELLLLRRVLLTDRPPLPHPPADIDDQQAVFNAKDDAYKKIDFDLCRHDNSNGGDTDIDESVRQQERKRLQDLRDTAFEERKKAQKKLNQLKRSFKNSQVEGASSASQREEHSNTGEDDLPSEFRQPDPNVELRLADWITLLLNLKRKCERTTTNLVFSKKRTKSTASSGVSRR